MALKTNKTKLLISRNNGISDKTKRSITLYFLWVLRQIDIPDFTSKPDLLPLYVLWKSTSKPCSSITSSKNYQTYSIMKYVPDLSFHTSWNIFFQYLVNPDFKEDVLIVHIFDIFPSKPKKKICFAVWAVLVNAQPFWPALAQASRITWFCKVYTEDKSDFPCSGPGTHFLSLTGQKTVISFCKIWASECHFLYRSRMEKLNINLHEDDLQEIALLPTNSYSMYSHCK